MEKKKILIVDDEMDMRIFMRTLFETSGYIPIVTKNGKEGLQRARQEKPSLVILDVMMPEKGGVYMYQNLRTDKELKEIPVIMLSGVGEKPFLHTLNMLNLQMKNSVPEPEAYMEKPPDPEKLLKLAKALVK